MRLKRALRYEERRTGGKLGYIDESFALAKQRDPYLVSDGITITMGDLSHAASGSEETVSSVSPAIDLMKMFRETMIQRFMELPHQIINEGKTNVSHNKVGLPFVKSGYTLGGYIQTLRDVDIGNQDI